MKKFFSAILLMTMMVFSVGTFVSCNDLVEEVETIKGQTSDIESTIKGLETQIAALETALKAEIKSAADQAKADAIKEAKAECEVLKAAFEQALAGKADTKALEELAALVEAKIAAIEPELAKMATKVELEDAVKELVATDTQLATQIAALEAYKATADTAFAEVEAAIAEAEKLQAELKAYVEENYTELHNLIGQNASYIASCIEDIDELKTGLAGYMETTDANIDEITGYLTSAIEDIDLLKGDVKKLQEDLAKMDEKFAKFEADIEKIDEDLKVFEKAISDLANQIQSLVWVPTGDVTVDSYFYGQTTTLRFLVTYEVSPARLAGELANANLYFTNVVKGEPARYEAEFVSAKDGRVVVRGKITDKNSAAYKLFTDPTAAGAATSVQVALHVDNAKPGTVGDTSYDGGTYVSSSFVPLTDGEAYHLGSLFYLYDTEEQKIIMDSNKDRITTYNKPIYVPYTTAVANSTRSFFPLDFVVKLEGNFVTLAEAAKYFGFSSLAPTYTFGDVVYSSDLSANDKTKDLIKVTDGKKINANAVLGRAAKKEDIGRTATAVITDIKVSGMDTYLKVNSTYEITNGKAADITFDDLNVTWSYKYANTIMGHRYVAAETPEVAVTSTSIDVTKLHVKTSATTSVALTTGATVEVVAKDKATGKVITLDDGITPKYYGTVGFHALSSKAVMVDTYDMLNTTGTCLDFVDKNVVYEARFTLIDPTTKVEYDGAFDVNLTAMPAKKEINLGNLTAAGADKYGVKIPVKAVEAVMAVDGNFYKDLVADGEIFSTNAQGAITKAYDFGTGWAADGNSTVTVSGTEMDAISLNFAGYDLDGDTVVDQYFAYEYDPALWSFVESSYVYIPDYASTYDGKYNLKWDYNLYGVEYTFVATVQLTMPQVSLALNPKFGNGVIPMVGTYKVPSYNRTDGFSSQPYVLNKIDLREYVNVVGTVAKNDEYNILYKVTTQYTPWGWTSPKKGDAIATITVPGGTDAADLSDDYTTADPEAEIILGWVDKSLNTIEVEMQLVSSSDNDVKFGDPVKVKLEVPELITVATEAVTVDYINAAGPSEANFVEGLVIKEALSGKNNKIYNANATSWTNYFDFVNTNVTNGAGTYNLFNIGYEVKTNKISAKLADGTPLNASDFNADAAGNVSVDMNSGAISQDVIVTVPVSITHDFQGDHAHDVEVKFTFKKK